MAPKKSIAPSSPSSRGRARAPASASAPRATQKAPPPPLPARAPSPPSAPPRRRLDDDEDRTLVEHLKLARQKLRETLASLDDFIERAKEVDASDIQAEDEFEEMVLVVEEAAQELRLSMTCPE